MTQNKVLPGAYINFVSRPRAMGSLGERGVVCVGMELDWGREGMTDIAAAKNSDFSSNRVVRVLDSIANDVANIFSKYYLGKQSNNANGRNLLKAEILAYHEELMKLEAIEGFTADDITVEKGTEKQDVVVYEAIQPVDAMEKLYMKVEVA